MHWQHVILQGLTRAHLFIQFITWKTCLKCTKWNFYLFLIGTFGGVAWTTYKA
ncbi:hypothetical protein AHAS_Ahas09G0134700 [Arachis hypogaea]